MATINSLTDGTSAVGSDEFVINRAGTDFKLNHTQIVAGVTALISAETTNRTNADTNLTNTKVAIAGDTLTGYLTAHADPTNALHLSTKQYVDAGDALNVPLSGGTMTGYLTLVGNPTATAHASNKAYVDQEVNTRWKNASPLSCSSNPNYPASTVGTTYRVTTAGKIGGTSGKDVQVDDLIYCHSTDATGGTQAAVGSSYIILQTNLIQSTDTDQGYIRIATTAERDAGTDNTVVMTPLGVREVVKDFVPNFDKISTANASITVPTTTQSALYLSSYSATGTVAVSLPLIANLSGSNDITIKIKDTGGNAGTNNITITASGANTIDGAATNVISTNYGVVELVTDGTNWFTV